MPRATIPSRPSTSTLTPSSSRARSARRVGVISLAGAFCRSRARFIASATIAARSTASPTSWCAETTRSSRRGGSSDGGSLKRSNRYAPSTVPSTSAPAASSPTWWGTSQHSARAPSSPARACAVAAAIRARSGVNASRSPRPTSTQRLPSAWATARCLKAGLASPASSSACSSPPLVSWAIDSPSKTPMATVSAGVSRGASVVAVTRKKWGSIDSATPFARPPGDALMPKTVILGTARTPIGKLGGGLSSLDATELGGTAIQAALERADVEPDRVQHVVMGQVLQAGQGQIPSRQAQIKAGIPKEVSSETINKVCASGLRASVLLDQAIRAGDLEVGVGGGMESMSQAPYLLPQARFGYRMGDAKALDAMVHDGLTNPFSGRQMFDEATEIGDQLELTRPDLDRWALRSHERAVAATDEGRLPEEIVPVTVKARKGDTVVEIDEGPRRDTSLETLAKLPGLGKNGPHTAGNSPGVNDGAGALVLASEDWAERNGKDVLGTIVAQAQVADEFAYLARTPANAALKALDKAGLQPSDIDLWEINEAFASVALNSVRMLNVDEERVNVNGGAVALGHPIGASGARILGAVVLELRRRGGGYGCVAICSGGGQGDAVIVHV